MVGRHSRFPIAGRVAQWRCSSIGAASNVDSEVVSEVRHVVERTTIYSNRLTAIEFVVFCKSTNCPKPIRQSILDLELEIRLKSTDRVKHI